MSGATHQYASSSAVIGPGYTRLSDPKVDPQFAAGALYHNANRQICEMV